MELKFEERVEELEGLLQQRQEDLLALRSEKECLEREGKAVVKNKRQLAIKLNALSRDHADLILDMSRQEEYLSEQQESLLSLQRSLEVEDAVSFKHQRSLLEVSGRIALEEERMTAVSASIFSCLLPVRESAREKERALDEARERLTRAKERCEAENADAFDSDRALKKSQIELDAMKSEYDKERTAFRARRDAFKESVFAISLENERARSDLQALRLECAELEQVEMEQCERYACRCCSTDPSGVTAPRVLTHAPSPLSHSFTLHVA